MSTSTIIPGLHKLVLPTPFGKTPNDIGDVNAYLAEGDPLTLIDCGTCTEEAYQALVSALAAVGYRVADIQRLVITHHHGDHKGLARRIVDESGAEVWAHTFGVPWLESPDDARRALNEFIDVIFHEGGVPDSVMAIMRGVSEYIDRLGGEPVTVAQTLGEGDQVELSGCRWMVYHTPGHAGDMLCFYEPESRVLLASDHLLRDVSSNPLIENPTNPGEERPRRLLDYLREMQRIAALDVRIAYPGHGDSIADVPGLVESRLAFHQKRAEKLYGLFSGQPRRLWELTRLLFPTVPETHQYLTLSEVLGHLDVLERDGQAIPEKRNGLVYWRPV
jgi:glyoxylase-like metal-dependent hydrolase (beta-lactamase superfamily II)